MKQKNNTKIVLPIILVLIICIFVIGIICFTTPKPEKRKETYVESSILDNVIRITGIYENPDLNTLFFNKESVDNEVFESSLLRERIIFANDYYDVIDVDSVEGLSYKIFKYKVSEDELKEIASDYNISNFDKYFDEGDIICERDPNSNVVSTEKCGEGSIKYYVVHDSSYVVDDGLFPHYSHNFKLYENEDDVILEDEMKVTYEPTNETKTKKITYTFSKDGEKYYLKNVA